MRKILTICLFGLIPGILSVAQQSLPTVRPHFDPVPEISGNIYCIHQDQEGFLWVGNKSGLYRFDGKETKRFSAQKGTPKLSFNYPQAILEDHKGRLWVGTRKGLNVLNKSRTENSIYLSDGSRRGMSHPEVRKIVQLDSVTYAIATYGGGLNIYHEAKGVFEHFQHKQEDISTIPGDRVNDLFLDNRHRLWVATEMGGLAQFHRSSGTFQRYTLPGHSSYTVSAVSQTQEGTVWVGTWKRGLFQLEERTGELKQSILEEGEETPLNTVRRLLPDGNQLWIGTLGGLRSLDLSSKKLTTYAHDPNTPFSVAGNAIWSLFKDREEILWVGTISNGLCKWDRYAHKFSPFNDDTNSPYRLKKDAVNCLFLDSKDRLWISTRNESLSLFDTRSHRFLDNQKLEVTRGKHITSICEDDQGHIWMTSDFGLYRWNDLSGTLDFFPRDLLQLEKEETGGLYTCRLDKLGNLYIGGWGIGMVRLTREKLNKTLLSYEDFDHYHRGNSLLKDHVVWQIVCDKRGWLWVHHKSGVQCFIPEKEVFRKNTGTVKNLRLALDPRGEVWGLEPVGDIYRLNSALQFDHYHRFEQEDIFLSSFFVTPRDELWVSSNQGIFVSKIDRPSYQVHYNKSDGLPNRSGFWKHTFLPDGRLLLGAGNGVVITDHEALKKNSHPPKILLSGILEDERPINHLTTPLEFPHDQNRLSFCLAANSFSSPSDLRFAYRLKDEENWYFADGPRPVALFSHLKPGNYTLEARSFNSDGVASPITELATFTIHPPWWFSWWAISGYFILGLGSLWVFLTYSLVSAKTKNKLAMQAFQQRQKEELLASRMEFLTNISHEIKTPLTLILGPIERLLEESEYQWKGTLETIKKNAHHLDNLVKELLELRHIEDGLGELRMDPVNLSQVCAQVAASYTELAEMRNIELVLQQQTGQATIKGDQLKLEKVFHNLISNAFRFTPEGGTITWSIGLDVGKVVVHLRDSGSGIPGDLLPHIFERGVTDNREGAFPSGFGIGLSLVRQIVEVHQGTIHVSNHPHGGAHFTLEFPLTVAPRPVVSLPTPHQVKDHTKTVEGTLLIVEDNPEIRDFLHALLEEKYNIIEASNGQEALDMAKDFQPNLILSDVMMPKMSGTEMTRQLKKDILTSHIPVILLTARAQPEDEAAGLEAQAQDYITKPFDSRLLLLKINTLLQQQRKWKQHFQRETLTEVDKGLLTGIDEVLLERVMGLIEENLAEPTFSVEFLAREVGMHRSQLTRKLRGLTDFTPIDLIKHLRLQKAHALLRSGKFTVSDVAYQVGFNNPRYFSTAFKAHFGKSPSEVKMQSSRENN